MRQLLLIALITLASGLGGCSKCDVPTFGWSGLLQPTSCSGEIPRR